MNDDADRHLATVKVARIKKEIDVDDVHSNINSEYEPIISGSVRVCNCKDEWMPLATLSSSNDLT